MGNKKVLDYCFINNNPFIFLQGSCYCSHFLPNIYSTYIPDIVVSVGNIVGNKGNTALVFLE